MQYSYLSRVINSICSIELYAGTNKASVTFDLDLPA
jgi:hypothetical protein